MIATIFTFTYDFFTAPRFVQHQIRLLTSKWGTDLDAHTPVCVRFKARLLARKYGVSGTPVS
jgi:hypothetical protein